MNKDDPGKTANLKISQNEKPNRNTQIVSTIKRFRIAFDEKKSSRNARERDLPFTLVEKFDFETASYEIDDRHAYPEMRIVALGLLGHRLHVLCFTPITEGIRVISFRKANPRETRTYEKAHSTDDR